jgi:hypothetical protein
MSDFERPAAVAINNITPLPSYTTVYFKPSCFKPQRQSTSLLNLRPLIFRLKLFGWSISTYLNLFYGNITFDLRPLFEEQNLDVKHGLGVILYVGVQ